MKKKKLWWVVIVLWCSVIFYQSSIPVEKSIEKSMFFVTVINNTVSALFHRDITVISDHAIRKTAHFIEFAILGQLLFLGFYNRQRVKRTILFAFLFGLAYAISDEIHQLFVPGRSMKITDMLIDTGGILCGIFILLMIIRKRYPFGKSPHPHPTSP